MDAYIEEWKALTNAVDLPAALNRHFSYLADTPGFGPVLDAVMQQALEVSYNEERLAVRFRGNECLLAYAPAEDIDGALPAGYQAILKRHALLVLEHGRLILGEHGEFNEDDGWFNAMEDSVLADFTTPDKLICPLWDYSDGWLYHPGEQNSQGDPVLYKISHEGGDIYDPQPYNIGSLFLKRCVEIAHLPVNLPVMPGKADAVAWWKDLDDAWKALLAKELKIENVDQVNKVFSVEGLYISKESGITTLWPIAIMERLESINCDAPGITDLEPLRALRHLQSIWFSSKAIVDFAPIGSLKGLQRLNLSGTSIVDLSPLANLVRLEGLELNDTGVRDITPLAYCKRLERLSLARTQVRELEAMAGLKKIRDLDITGSPVQSFDCLDRLRDLGCLKADDTRLSVIPKKCTNIYILRCRNTRVSFEEVLRFMAVNKRRPEDGIGLTIYCDYNRNEEALANAMEKVDFELGGLQNVLTTWVNDTLISILTYNQEKSIASRLLAAYLHLPVRKVRKELREELAANALVGIVGGHIDKATADAVFEKLITKKIALPRLQYNLACYYAQQQDKPKLLLRVAAAIRQGYDPAKFKQDADFINFRNDADFLHLLANPPLPDPYEDAVAWFQSLPADLRDTLEYKLDESSAESILDFLESEEVSLYHRYATNLAPLRYIKGLTSLTLDQCKATSLEQVAFLTGLNELKCEKGHYGSGVQYEDITPLAGLKQLQSLELQGHLIRDLTPLSDLSGLEKLDVSGNPIENAVALKCLTRLTSLSISLATPEATDLSFLAGLVHLQDLGIYGHGEQDIIISLDALGNLRELRSLYLYGLTPSSGNYLSLKPLSGLLQLERLYVRALPFDSLEPLYGLKSLHTLYVENIAGSLKEEVERAMPWCKVNG